MAGSSPKIPLSVVVPAYNEEGRLGPTLEKIRAHLRRRRLRAEILVVDDGSADGTAALVRALARKDKALRLVSQPRNLGKGAAVARGVREARGALVLFTDADLSTPIEELDPFLPLFKAREGFDVVVGSRALSRSRILKRQPFYRHFGGKLFNRAVRLLTLGGFSDTQCGFKMFRRQAGRIIFEKQRIPGFGFDVEFLYLAKKYGYACVEVPVSWTNSPESKVSLRAALLTFWDLVAIRFNDWTGRYGPTRAAAGRGAKGA